MDTAVTVYTLGLFFFGVFFLLRSLIDKDWDGELNSSDLNVKAYDIWLFIFCLLCVLSLTPNLLGWALPESGGLADNSSSTLILRAFLSQLALLLFLISSYRLHSEFWNGSLYWRNCWSRVSLREACFFFFISIAVVYGVNLLWQGILAVMIALGGLKELPLQDIVEAFKQQGNPIWVRCIAIFTAVVLAPIVEEWLFRGVLYRLLKKQMPALVAAGLSSLIFAWIHGNLAVFLPLVALSMMLCQAYEKTGRISVSIGLHALFNLNTVVMIYLGGYS